ncbi:unnamed protein product [Prorocentrum cordatum]|uniref:Uncharacterized protein n=1 Tax=Prorocentrum cordatum TaxID=2364126 RepID=A0ABN9V9B7_9DINO|nr:unnamed protein product [Polarella glacialis]
MGKERRSRLERGFHPRIGRTGGPWGAGLYRTVGFSTHGSARVRASSDSWAYRRFPEENEPSSLTRPPSLTPCPPLIPHSLLAPGRVEQVHPVLGSPGWVSDPIRTSFRTHVRDREALCAADGPPPGPEVEGVPPCVEEGGILLPDSAAKPPNWGKVLAVGPGRLSKEGDLLPMNVKVGDTVVVPEYGGITLKLDDEEYHVFRDEDIMGVIQE